MNEEIPKKPPIEVQKITDADPPYHNCPECGAWLLDNEKHNHQEGTPT